MDPPKLRAPGQRAARPEPTPRKYDFAGRDERNRKLGRKGEEFVVEFEKRSLREAGRPDLAEQVEWVSQTRGDGAGYDIASFEASGEPLQIEVKTTNAGKTFPFLISRNELEFAEAHAETFVLYRVFEFSKAPRLFRLRWPLHERCRLEPKVYQCGF